MITLGLADWLALVAVVIAVRALIEARRAIHQFDGLDAIATLHRRDLNREIKALRAQGSPQVFMIASTKKEDDHARYS